MNEDDTLLSLDIGEKRIGLAISRGEVHIARPLATLHRSKQTIDDIKAVVAANGVTTLVAGYPRGLDGQRTAQTFVTEEFIAKLRQNIDIPIVLQDEALTSVKAEAELKGRGRPFKKEEVDALAATYILEDYMMDHIKESHA